MRKRSALYLHTRRMPYIRTSTCNYQSPITLLIEFVVGTLKYSSVMLNYAGKYCEYGEYCDARQVAVTVIRSLEVLPGVAYNELHNQ